MIDDEEMDCFEYILAEVRRWQENGKNGFSLPVIQPPLLNRLEVISDRWIRDNCTCCGGTGSYDDGYEKSDCVACEPLADE
jgi:hypothetical protein